MYVLSTPTAAAWSHARARRRSASRARGACEIPRAATMFVSVRIAADVNETIRWLAIGVQASGIALTLLGLAVVRLWLKTTAEGALRSGSGLRQSWDSWWAVRRTGLVRRWARLRRRAVPVDLSPGSLVSHRRWRRSELPACASIGQRCPIASGSLTSTTRSRRYMWCWTRLARLIARPSTDAWALNGGTTCRHPPRHARRREARRRGPPAFVRRNSARRIRIANAAG